MARTRGRGGDAVWAATQPLLPAPPEHPLGCHRPRVPDRLCLWALLIRLTTGASWVDIEAILDHRVSDTTLRARRDGWIAVGVFEQLPAEALAAFDHLGARRGPRRPARRVAQRARQRIGSRSGSSRLDEQPSHTPRASVGGDAGRAGRPLPARRGPSASNEAPATFQSQVKVQVATPPVFMFGGRSSPFRGARGLRGRWLQAGARITWSPEVIVPGLVTSAYTRATGPA